MEAVVCLACYRDLPEDRSGPLVACVCGVRYTLEVLAARDPVVWARILRRDGFRVLRHSNNELVVTRVYG